MIIRYSPDLIDKLKKVNVRIRKSFKEKIIVFEKNPHDGKLNNHELQREYKGLKSIDITSDYRAIYREFKEGEDIIIEFFLLGTHKELYTGKIEIIEIK